MSVLITGGAGFIGSHLCERLIREGHSVTAIDNFSTGQASNVDSLKESENFKMVEGSILDISILNPLIAEADYVFHLAAAVGVFNIVKNPLASLLTNIRGTENVLESAHATKTPVFLTSSSEVYGKNISDSLKESDDRILGSPVTLRWSYSEAKAIDESLAYAYFIEKQFQELKLTVGYEKIKKAYRSDRKKDLKRAEKSELRIEWGGSPSDLITLFQNNVGKRTPEIKQQDYQNLETLINFCLIDDYGELCFTYQGETLVAAAFFLKHKETVTILCSSTDFSNRKNGANTFLIDEAIQRYINKYKTLNFGGSSMQTIAKYFFSFGAQEKTYPMLVKRLKFL